MLLVLIRRFLIDWVKFPLLGELKLSLSLGLVMWGSAKLTPYAMRRFHIQKRRKQCDYKGRDWSEMATSQGMLAATTTWNRKGRGSPLEPLEGAMALPTPLLQPSDANFEILDSKTVENKFLLF